jgi:two-component system sensor histidine kinase/response regulator
MSSVETASTNTEKPVILIVDDCDSSREILCALLTPLNAQVEQAESGEQALAIISQIKPALVLLDVNMPGISGFEVCQQLRDKPETRDITILFVSALGDLEHRVKGLSGGGVDYIPKPFEPDEVLARVSIQLELFKLRTRLLERNRTLEELLREKDRFLDMAAHGLRHPLLQVRGLVGLLRGGQLGEIGRKTLVNTIAQASERMNHLLNDVLEVHDLEAGTLNLNPVPLSVTKIVQQCLEVWSHQADSREVSISAHLAQVPQAVYDKDKLTQVLETILAQAVESTPAQSTLSIGLEGDDTSFRLTVTGAGWLTEAYAGLVGSTEEFGSTTLSKSIVAKLIRHFEGSVQLLDNKLTLELPLNTGFSQDSSKNGQG